MSSKNPEKSLQRSESHLLTSTPKETNRKLLRLSTKTKTKKMSFLKQENSATPIQLRFKQLCGGIIDDQMKKFGIWRHLSEKMK